MNNLRIGMAINYDYPDYGGMLQAYASFRKIKDLGYEPEAINVCELQADIKRRKMLYFMSQLLDKTVVKEKSRLVLKKLYTKINKNLDKNLKKRYRALDSFSKKKFRVTKAYSTWNDLSNACYDYDAVVVGSDQLWLPSNIAGDYYTLSFVPSPVKKIAYATSFGVSKIVGIDSKKISGFLERIEYLSAREESGQRIIKKYTGRDAELVCDPVFLLSSSEWNQEISSAPIMDQPYIFCYFMGDNPWQREFVKKIKERTNYKIVALLHLDQYIKGDEEYVDYAPYDVDPAGFINYIKNAQIVCTDSFHGSVFSIVFHKRFYTFKRFSQNETLSTNTRIDTLLNRLSLQQRLVKSESDFDSKINNEIDWDSVQESLDSYVQSSLCYLSSALKS